MSMYHYFLAVPQQTLELAQSGETEHVDAFLHRLITKERNEEFSIGKAWHAAHFLLTLTDWDETLPLGFILGGQPLGESYDAGYGPPLGLTRDEVASIAGALAELNMDELMSRWDFKTVSSLNLYSVADEDGEDFQLDGSVAVEELVLLREFVMQAADQGQALISYMV